MVLNNFKKCTKSKISPMINQSYFDIVVNLEEEDGFIENKKSLEIQQARMTHQQPLSKNNIFIFISHKIIRRSSEAWGITVNKYMDSVDAAFDKSNITSKKLSNALDHLPEPTSSKRLIQITVILFFIVVIIFLVSCQSSQNMEVPKQTRAINNRSYLNTPTSFLQHTPQQLQKKEKQSEQLYIQREILKIRSKEEGSTTGSIWADALAPTALSTEYQPLRAGEMVSILIPEELQFDSDTMSDISSADSLKKFEPVETFHMEIVNYDPAGYSILRGTKNYTGSRIGDKNLTIMAEIPTRDLNQFNISATKLTRISLSEDTEGMNTSYESMGWDKMLSRKIAGFTPDINTALSTLDNQKKEIDIQKKALADQKKSLDNDTDRIKKDRTRLDADRAHAQKVLQAASSVEKAIAAEELKNKQSSEKENKGTATTNSTPLNAANSTSVAKPSANGTSQ